MCANLNSDIVLPKVFVSIIKIKTPEDNEPHESNMFRRNTEDFHQAVYLSLFTKFDKDPPQTKSSVSCCILYMSKYFDKGDIMAKY